LAERPIYISFSNIATAKVIRIPPSLLRAISSQDLDDASKAEVRDRVDAARRAEAALERYVSRLDARKGG